jgi:hypothetical protein
VTLATSRVAIDEASATRLIERAHELVAEMAL